MYQSFISRPASTQFSKPVLIQSYRQCSNASLYIKENFVVVPEYIIKYREYIKRDEEYRYENSLR